MQVQMSEKDEPNSKRVGGKLTAMLIKMGFFDELCPQTTTKKTWFIYFQNYKALHDLPASFVSSLFSSQPQYQYCERKTRSLI